MKLDHKVMTGILIGVVFGLHYHTVLAAYVPLLLIAAIIMLLKLVHR